MEEPRFVEPVVIPDIFVSGIANVEQLSQDVFRLTFYADQKSPIDGVSEQIIVAKLIVTREALAMIEREKAVALAGFAAGTPPVLVKPPEGKH